MSDRLTCDIFCRVIDNFGDAGVTWRLARAFASEYQWAVRLFIDNRKTLQALAPNGGDSYKASRVMVQDWQAAAWSTPAKVVIEGFGCRLPENYEKAMASDAQQRLWLNLEYLTAEDWAKDFHKKASPHPTLPLTKYFWLPGVTEGLGGITVEKGLAEARAAFGNGERSALLSSLGADPAAPLTLLVFCYPGAPLADFAAALAADGRPTQLLLPPGAAGDALAKATEGLACVHAVRIPFVAQPDFDRLLWACDAAVVRGEDSFARAQLAGIPFAWHIYPQDEGVHMTKLAAFDRALSAALPADAAAARRTFERGWNEGHVTEQGWKGWRDSFAALAPAMRAWGEKIAARPTLQQSISDFSKAIVK